MLCLAVHIYLPSFSQYRYPPTRTVDSSDTYFGVIYKDPYRWLEHIETPEAESWFKRQATYTDSVLNHLNGRDELIEEWKRFSKQQPAIIPEMYAENGRIFIRKRAPGEKVAKIYYREGENGADQFLFDPSAYIPGRTFTVRSMKPSHDGKKLAISYIEKGYEVPVVKIMDVDTRRFEKDSLYPAWSLTWTPDNKSILYFWHKSTDSKDTTGWSKMATKRHILGTDPHDDPEYFSKEHNPELNLVPRLEPVALYNPDAKDYLLSELVGTSNDLVRYYAHIEQLSDDKIPWKPLTEESDSIADMVFVNGDIYALTHNHARFFKVVRTSLSHPDWSAAETIAPERPGQTLRSITRCKDYLLMTYNDGINDHLSKYDFRTSTFSDIKLPWSGSLFLYCLDDRSDDCYIVVQTWTTQFAHYKFDPATDATTTFYWYGKIPAAEAFSNLKVEEVEARGHDGVMIPLTIISKKGIKKDGSNICIMDGYGAYGISQTPQSDYMVNSLAERGVVIAIAHVRGGSEKGDAWYRAGYKTTKPNTWKDFISCAQYLIDSGYTSPQKLAGSGTSAGGILISRAITERPDLFAAAICNVGVANAMRFEFTSNGHGNISEFGTVKDSIESRALYEMDGVQHVMTGTKYPAVLTVAGWNDRRVVPWVPGKFAAALQNASVSDKPALLMVDYNNGHFTEDQTVMFANFADQYAFVLWQCGHPDFQPKK
jgi:prolyl oligopeptidase